MLCHLLPLDNLLLLLKLLEFLHVETVLELHEGLLEFVSHGSVDQKMLIVGQTGVLVKLLRYPLFLGKTF